MSDIERFLNDARKTLEGLIGSGISALRPDNNYLFNASFDFSALNINREKGTNLIGVIHPEIPEFPCYDKLKHEGLGFGDSAHHTGFLAFLNSEVDKQNLPLYEVKGKRGFMYRHPTQAPWNNWKNCTRDQLLAFAAGCWRAKKYDIIERLLEEHNKRLNAVGFPLCQNSEKDCPMTIKQFYETDILTPVDVMFLRICSGDFDSYLDPVGQLNLQIAIEITSKDVTLEKNQLILQAIVCGRLDFYVEIHDNYKENIRYYWGKREEDGGGQHMPEIGEAFISIIEQELQRYNGLPKPKRLGIPFETLKVALPAIFAGLVGGPALATLLLLINSDKLLKALAADIQEFGKEIENYISDVIKNPLNIVNIPFMPFNPVAQLVNSLFKGTDLSEVHNRLNYIQKEIDILKNRIEELARKINELPDKVIKILYSNDILDAINKYKDTSDNFNKILNKIGLEKAKEQCRTDFEDVHNIFSKNLIRTHDYTDHYLNIPFIISCMNIHISTLSMLGKEPIYIAHFVGKYRKQIDKILNDNSDTSLKKWISDLISIQTFNITQLKALYTFMWNISEEEGMEEIGKKVNLAEPVDFGIRGTIQKIDYELLELFEPEKINDLRPLLDNPISPVSQELLPKKLERVIKNNGTFGFGGTYGVSIAKFETTIELKEFETLIKPKAHFVWNASGKQINIDFIYPKENETLIDSFVQKNITDGENLINVGLVLLDGLKELEKIDEILKTCDELS